MSGLKRIFICSDWHLGGRRDEIDDGGGIVTPGFQICRSTRALTEFIDWIRGQVLPENEVELVVNGDMVDFLTPDNDYDPVRWLADESAVIARLNAIADQAQGADGRGPFEALRDLLAAGGTLTIMLGNHDVELSLPRVRAALVERLAAAGRRFEFIYDGEACVRGRLLIEHGNRYDPFNVVDFSSLRQERSHISRGLSCLEEEREDNFFLPPYGSELVVQVYNRLLPQAPFLNLLKPENEAALPLVLAICPNSRGILEGALMAFNLQKACVVNRLRRPAQPGRAGQLAASTDQTFRSLDNILTALLGDNAKWFKPEEQLRGNLRSGHSLQAKLATFEEQGRILAGKVSLLEDLAQIFFARTDERRLQQVRIALRKVRDVAVFDVSTDSGQYLDAAREMIKVGGFTTVVFGHTHLAKSIPVEGGTYFNCGTWADMLRLPESIGSEDTVKADADIGHFVEKMRVKDITPYLWRRLNYVEAYVLGDGSVTAELREFKPQATPIQ